MLKMLIDCTIMTLKLHYAKTRLQHFVLPAGDIDLEYRDDADAFAMTFQDDGKTKRFIITVEEAEL